MNLLPSCVQRKYHHGIWNLLLQLILQTPNLCRGTSGHGHLSCPHPLLMFLHFSAFSYGESQRGRDPYPSPNFSTTAKANSVGFCGNSQVTSVSPNSMHWPNRVESVTDSFAPVV
ncbi:hypothetical protein OIU74_015445, partial [Salix koriyanagi]